MFTASSRRSHPAVITLGRLGDLTAALPIAHELYYQTGQPVPFITAREYTPLLEACSYVIPEPVDLPFHKLGRAIAQNRPRCSRLHIAQVYSTDEPARTPVTDSFVTDAWHRAEMLDRFGLPLVLDRRDRQREVQLLSDYGLQGSQPYVVLHAGGISSPYRHRHAIITALRGLRVVDITALTATKPQDLLAVLERASCAILADSFPLHLSYALRHLPVIALQTDRPTPWYASPPRPNWIASFGYEESLLKLEEIRTLAASFGTRATSKITFPAGAYNASVLNNLYTWRHHPNGTWQTRLQGLDRGIIRNISLPHPECSHEDARLFTLNGKPHLSYTLSKYIDKKPRCVIEYGELITSGSGGKEWKVKNPHRVHFGNNDWSALEKNHVFFSLPCSGGLRPPNPAPSDAPTAPKLYCLYGSQPEQVVLEVEGSKVVQVHRSPGATWPFGEIRGDVILPLPDGALLRVFHSCYRYRNGKFRYHLGAARLEATPPFRTLSITRAPLFSGDESRSRTTFHSKPNVVFTCGARIEGDELIVPISFNDDQTTLERIKLNQLGI